MSNNDFHPPSKDPRYEDSSRYADSQSTQTQPIETVNSNQDNHNTQYMPPQYDASQYGTPQYAAPQGGMPAGGYPGNYYSNYRPWNAWAIAGFIVSFFAGIIGVVLSIIGLVQIDKRNERGRGLAIAGIVVGAISTLLAILMTVGVATMITQHGLENGSWNMEYSWDSGNIDNPGGSGQNDSVTQGDGSLDGSAGDSTDLNAQGDSVFGLSPGVALSADYVEDVADDIEGSIDDSMDDIHARNTSVNTLDDLIASDVFIAAAKREAAELAVHSVAMEYSVDGDTITYQYTTDDRYAEFASVLERELSDFDNDMQDTINQMGRVCATNDKLNLRLYIVSESGSTIFDRTYTER